ncbi:MAG: hypothetical protein QOG91_528 [Candidatus Parcubacteria bacterium]|nr:hypothetical protein [Candidatus Parcubacteria bacterium]
MVIMLGTVSLYQYENAGSARYAHAIMAPNIVKRKIPQLPLMDRPLGNAASVKHISRVELAYFMPFAVKQVIGRGQ